MRWRTCAGYYFPFFSETNYPKHGQWTKLQGYAVVFPLTQTPNKQLLLPFSVSWLRFCLYGCGILTYSILFFEHVNLRMEVQFHSRISICQMFVYNMQYSLEQVSNYYLNEKLFKMVIAIHLINKSGSLSSVIKYEKIIPDPFRIVVRQ